MLRHYEITNFKAFGKTQVIPFKPITLIYGPNSAGKSSIIQSLLLLKQTLEDADNLDTMLLPQGKLTNLGNYREFIHSHDIDCAFSIKIILDVENEFDLGLGLQFVYDQDTASPILTQIDVFQEDTKIPILSYKIDLDNNIFSITEIYPEHPFWQNWWKSFKQQLHEEFFQQVNRTLKEYNRLKPVRRSKKGISNALEKQIEPLKEDLEKVKPENRSESELAYCIDEIETLIDLEQQFSNYTLDDAIQDFRQVIAFSSGLGYRNFLPENSILFEEDENLRYKWKFKHLLQIHQALKTNQVLDNLTLKASEAVRKFLTEMIYIAPLRDYPERLYTFSGNVTDQVGKTGKGIADLLFTRDDVLESLNQKFQTFNLGYRIKTVKFMNQDDHQISDIFTLRLVDQLTNIDVSLLDVGFGISQILPVLVQSVASRNRTIVIEQPEVHIHPRLQTELGDLFIESIKSFGNRFIIETHSEHLILRIQRRIREGQLTPDDVLVLYVDHSNEGSACLELRLDSEGDFIDEWPDGFFEEGYKEIF